MQMKTRIIIVGQGMLICGLLIWMGSRIAQNSVRTTAAGPQSNKLYSMNVVVSGVPFWKETRDAWSKIGQVNEGVKTEFGGPLDTAVQKQIAEIEAIVAKGCDGLVIAPCDSAALVPTINRVVEKGIPVITYLVDSPKSKRLTYIASPQEDSAHIIGEHVAKICGYKGKVIIMYAQAGNEEQERRVQGFKEVMEKHVDMKLVGIVEDKYDEGKGTENLKPLLVQHPDTSVIFGCDSRSAVGAVVALKELNSRPGQIFITGWDHDEDVLNLIKVGWVEASVAQQSTYMTMLCYSILDAYSRGYLYPGSMHLQENNVSPLPDTISVPVTLVTKENAAAFSAVKGQ